MRAEIEGAMATPMVSPSVFQDARIHMIGIGGSGMSAAAMMLLKLGATLTGSDQISFDGLGTLVQKGAQITIGDQRRPIDPSLDWVIHSAAIPESNVELSLARRLGIRTIKYAELIGLLMVHYQGVAIAGTHGKSTTTAMAAFLFSQAGLNPSYIFGARSRQLGGASDLGTGEHFIVESCEFDRSFLHVRPSSAAILNLEIDHVDCFRNLDEILEAFSSFASNVKEEGVLVYNADEALCVKVSSAAKAKVESFGLRDGADWQAIHLQSDHGRYSFEVQYQDEILFSTKLSIPGLYNVSNALAAIALAYHAGAHPDCLADSVASFSGIDRRLTLKGVGGGVTIVDDYAHHPTEIKVTLEAAQNRYKPRRTWVIFQPHQVARTTHFMDQFATSLAVADEVIIPDVFGARESDAIACREGSQELALKISQQGKRARYFSTLNEVTDHLVANISKGDLVMTMGAGDVWKVADELVERICKSS